jgi:outer membrane lipoprotein-sorting protein
LTSRRPDPYNESVLGALLIVLVVVGAVGDAAAADSRAAVDAFLARLGSVNVTSLVVDQTLTVYDPAGRQAKSTGEQRLYLKLPRRQRIERVVDGQREVRLHVDNRVWVRGPDGRTYEAPPLDQRRDRTHLLVPFRRTGADLLSEWNAHGVRADLNYQTQAAGRLVTVIGATPGERSAPQVWLDSERGVVRFVARERLPGGESVVDLTFSEHRPLAGGFVFPYRQEAFVNGKLVLLMAVRSAAVNTNPDDALFDPDALKRGR